MTPPELQEKYEGLYQFMAQSKDPRNMMAFGHVMNEMMDWLIVNKPELAQAWIEKLERIKWKNYLTLKESESIVGAMVPRSPWTREQWTEAMKGSSFAMEEQPCYNANALYTVMQMIMSDSAESIKKYVDSGNLFAFVHDLAVDKLKDKDGNFSVRAYFGL